MTDPDRATLLVVDDAPENIQVLAGILSGDYKVKVAKSGEKALEIIAKGAPDLILLDVIMPGMDGYEVCRRVKADPASAAVPVVFVSGNDSADDKAQGEQAGGAGFLHKPVDAEQVRETVRALLQR